MSLRLFLLLFLLAVYVGLVVVGFFLARHGTPGAGALGTLAAPSGVAALILLQAMALIAYHLTRIVGSQTYRIGKWILIKTREKRA